MFVSTKRCVIQTRDISCIVEIDLHSTGIKWAPCTDATSFYQFPSQYDQQSPCCESGYKQVIAAKLALAPPAQKVPLELNVAAPKFK